MDDNILDEYDHKLEPYIRLNTAQIPAVIVLLEENNIEFELEKVMGSMNDTGIVPMSSGQLENLETIIHISKEAHLLVDVIMEDYYAEQKQKQDQRIDNAAPTASDAFKNRAFVAFSILFLLIILFKAYLKFLNG